jgi:hypothetical protein
MDAQLHQACLLQLSPVERPSPYGMPFLGPLGAWPSVIRKASTVDPSTPLPLLSTSKAYELQDDMPSWLFLLQAHMQEDIIGATLHNCDTGQLSPKDGPSPHGMPFLGPLGAQQPILSTSNRHASPPILSAPTCDASTMKLSIEEVSSRS